MGRVKTRKRNLSERAKKVATLESIGSSTRIEGANLSNNEIASLIKHIKVSQLTSRDEQEVVGYYNTLEIIFDNYQMIELTENYIKQLHHLLLRYSAKDERHRDEYKKLSNQIGANYPDGTQKIIFNTTQPHLVNKEMQELVKWVQIQEDTKAIYPSNREDTSMGTFFS
ncbi:MAG: hypothetical protein HC880_00145 [Bacteroidia bacterium]|nr:hypothetical protein [Bacteroidia bacterium]